VTLLAAAAEYVMQNPRVFREALVTHLLLSASALAVAVLLAVPLGAFVARRPRAAFVAVNAANAALTIPSLAVVAVMLPVLGIGFLPSFVALVILGVPPILTNTCVGIGEVDADVVEGAAGMGMTTRQILRRVELPLAIPVILAGVRTSAVSIVASATLAAFIGGGGLGDFITMGIGMMQVDLMLVGAIPVTVLAILTEVLFGRIERALTPRGMRDPA
jgi:osmoprotectant transport system permease protein